MDETEREQYRDVEEDGDEEDDSYTNAYLNDDDDNDDDDEDLAEMFAKVKTIQQTEGIQPSERSSGAKTPTLDVKILPATASRTPTASAKAGSRSNGSTPTSARRSSKSPSSNGFASGSAMSEDGIKTISRRALSGAGSAASTGAGVRIDALLNVRKPAIYDDKLLQSAKSSDVLEKLKMKTVMAAPSTIAKRIEDLSVPAKKNTGRKFATDDEERHCRFQTRKSAAQKAAKASDYDNDGAAASGRNDFIARMEAAEKSKRKSLALLSRYCVQKLEMTRGENEYNARLDKKCCPKCGMPQSYSEYKDKKKRCQMCGVEFRIMQAWGDVGSDFIARMSETSQARADKQQQIRAQVVHQETHALKVQKTAKQQFYEKQMLQKTSQRTFLERNYESTSTAKTKQAQVEMQIQRAKLMASSNGSDSLVI